LKLPAHFMTDTHRNFWFGLAVMTPPVISFDTPMNVMGNASPKTRLSWHLLRARTIASLLFVTLPLSGSPHVIAHSKSSTMSPFSKCLRCSIRGLRRHQPLPWRGTYEKSTQSRGGMLARYCRYDFRFLSSLKLKVW
jgi:hypothetical protein